MDQLTPISIEKLQRDLQQITEKLCVICADLQKLEVRVNRLEKKKQNQS